jgi:hypothetical protein
MIRERCRRTTSCWVWGWYWYWYSFSPAAFGPQLAAQGVRGANLVLPISDEQPDQRLLELEQCRAHEQPALVADGNAHQRRCRQAVRMWVGPAHHRAAAHAGRLTVAADGHPLNVRPGDSVIALASRRRDSVPS